MNPENVKSAPKKHRKTELVTIRISPDIKSWLIENDFSQTGIFYEAIKDLGYKKE